MSWLFKMTFVFLWSLRLPTRSQSSILDSGSMWTIWSRQDVSHPKRISPSMTSFNWRHSSSRLMPWCALMIAIWQRFRMGSPWEDSKSYAACWEEVCKSSLRIWRRYTMLDGVPAKTNNVWSLANSQILPRECHYCNRHQQIAPHCLFSANPQKKIALKVSKQCSSRHRRKVKIERLCLW